MCSLRCVLRIHFAAPEDDSVTRTLQEIHINAVRGPRTRRPTGRQSLGRTLQEGPQRRPASDLGPTRDLCAVVQGEGRLVISL